MALFQGRAHPPAYVTRIRGSIEDAAMRQIGHTAGQSQPLPKTCPSRGAIPTWDVVQGSLGGAMSEPSPTTHRFDVSNNRRVRLRIGAAAMGAGIVVFAYVALYGNAIAAPMEYAVDGVAVGTQLNFDSASYREYKCSPSDQFDGLTWCQKTRSDKERRRSYIAAYSLLHSRDGNILYINRTQEPAFFNPKEV